MVISWLCPTTVRRAEQFCRLRAPRLSHLTGLSDQDRAAAEEIDVRSFFTLRGPNRRIPFPIVADNAFYYDGAIPVDPAIRDRRLLTGADFDIESFREEPDGTLWFGDEFGPFLLHTDRRAGCWTRGTPSGGHVAAESAARDGAGESAASRGFEGMAITPDGKTLYPMLEGALTTDPDPAPHHQRVRSAEAPIHGRQWFYRLERGRASRSETSPPMTDERFLVIERDNFQGAAAAFKKIYHREPRDSTTSGSWSSTRSPTCCSIGDPQTSAGRPALSLSVPDDRERHPLSNAHARRARRQQLSLQQRPGGRAVRPQRVHRHSAGPSPRAPAQDRNHDWDDDEDDRLTTTTVTRSQGSEPPRSTMTHSKTLPSSVDRRCFLEHTW